MDFRTDKLLHGGDYNPEQWLKRPDILEKDIDMLEESGCNVVSLGIFSWSTLEPEEGVFHFEWLQEIIDKLYKRGISTILATPSGARPKWMADKYPEVLRVDETRHRALFGFRHNHCYTSPVYREKVHIINKKLAQEVATHPGVILWHISNEYGGECHCPLCQEAFRNWLKEKYQTIENLNDKWCTTFWSHTYNSFDQIESPSKIGETQLHALNLDWKRFVTHQTADFIHHEIAALREGGSTLPTTANLMHYFGGLDYFKIAKEMGADYVINASQTDPVEEVMKITGGIGVDNVIEAVGNPRTYEQAFKMLRRGGKLEAFGICAEDAAAQLEPYVCDTITLLHKALEDDKKVVVEGAQATLLDIDFGSYPYVTSSNPTIGGILTGTGLSASDIGNVYGVIKAYSSRVGEGPYVTELLDATGDKIRELGHEYGTTTGRPRRCGWLDLVTLKYAKRLNGLTALSVNHLDTIGKFDTIKVCTGYDVNGEVTEDFTTNLKVLNNAKPVYEELKGGWGDEIASCKTFEELPENAQKYISFIEKYIGVPVKFIGTGAEREAMIVRADN